MTTLSQIPLVIDDDMPFVFHSKADPRPFLDVGGNRLRRGADRVWVEMPVRGAWISTVILDTDTGSYLMASLGPVLAKYWQAFEKKGIDFLTVRERINAPTLFSAIANKKVVICGPGWTHSFSVAPLGNVNATSVVFGVAGHADTELYEFIALSMFPARTALDILNEMSGLKSTRSVKQKRVSADQFLESFDEVADKLEEAIAFVNKALEA